MMYSGYARTGQIWWLGSPYRFDDDFANVRYVGPSGSYRTYSVRNSYGLRPAVVLKPGVEISEGNGTYNSPYIVDTSNN